VLLAFDAVGSGGINSAAASSVTWSHTAAAGADVFAFCESPTNNSSFNPSGVTYNGTPMTLYASDYLVPYNDGMQLWHLAAAGTGGSASLVATWANAFYGVCNSISFTDVTSVSAPAYIENTNNSAAATQSVTLTGTIILQSFGYGNDFGSFGPTVSGGTAQYMGYDPVDGDALSINTATATTTFTASEAGRSIGIAVQLS
jgi:hypothetical protein